TDLDLKFRLQEITREKIFNKLEKELPYSIYVKTDLFCESERKARVYQSIVVMKDSQKGIVLGRGGNMIKSIREEAAADMKNLLGKKVELKLFVKVKERWTERKERLRDAGISL
ncbi:MAG: KH domain-containing protein, partial [Holosporales bacterium]|nr:KH domain-containing protein [Holosporales bacterium]